MIRLAASNVERMKVVFDKKIRTANFEKLMILFDNLNM